MQRLTESDTSLIKLALYASAEKWEEWSRTIARPDIAETSRLQAEQARTLANRMAEADSVMLAP